MKNLIHGDALERLQDMTTQSFACAVTSPPYNIGHHHQRARNERRWEGAYPDFSDRMELECYIHYHRQVLTELLRVVQPDGLLWWVHRRRPSARGRAAVDVVDRVLDGFPVRDEIIWHKVGGGVFNLPHRGRRPDVCYPANQYETVFLLAPTPEAGVTREVAVLGDVWSIARQRVPGFPATFPVALAAMCIRGTAAQGSVIDPFMGTGSTAIAAQQLGRSVTGIELSEKTLAIAQRRVRLATARNSAAAGSKSQKQNQQAAARLLKEI